MPSIVSITAARRVLSRAGPVAVTTTSAVLLAYAVEANAAHAKEDGTRCDEPCAAPPPGYTNSFGSMSMCRCEVLATPTSFPESNISVSDRQDSTGPRLNIPNIQRRRSVRRLNETATRSTLEQRFEIDPIPLGEGSYGEVFLATDRHTGEKLALKKIHKIHTDEIGFQREMGALLHVRDQGGHPNICMLRENFDEKEHYVILLDLIRGGEVFDHLINHGAFSEADAARLMREVASALHFLHGIGIVHADLKPENLMLSSKSKSDAEIKVVDFGCAEVLVDAIENNEDEGLRHRLQSLSSRTITPGQSGATTPAYCPPEAFEGSPVAPAMDLWALGVILFVMLCGVHPFDLEGTATDEEIEERVRKQQTPPLHDQPYTEHLSSSAIDLLSRLMELDPAKRMTAYEMLEHPWVLGKTARKDIIAGSDKKLSKFRKFRTRIEAKMFKELVNWSDNDRRQDVSAKGTSLIQRAFSSLDRGHKGFLTVDDIVGGSHADGLVDKEADNETQGQSSLSLSSFSDLVGDHMKSKYFPRGHVVYREGDKGEHMYFINSGNVSASTQDGFYKKLGQGDSFGEGGLLDPERGRSGTIKCLTPVHAIEIDKDYFMKYLSSSDSDLALKLREKVNVRKFGRAEFIIGQHKSMKQVNLARGEYVFKEGQKADALYIVEKGHVAVRARGKTIYSLKPGEIFGVQSLTLKRPRAASAVCASGECKLKAMAIGDYTKLLQNSPKLEESLRELCLRREFRRAVVLKTRKSFPRKAELKAAFDAIDLDETGMLNIDELRDLLKHLDNSLSDREVNKLLHSMDLNESGKVTFEEFQSIFGKE